MGNVFEELARKFSIPTTKPDNVQRERNCLYCRRSFSAIKNNDAFCSGGCSQAYKNVKKNRGQKVGKKQKNKSGKRHKSNPQRHGKQKKAPQPQPKPQAPFSRPDYHEYILSAEWKARATAAKERAGWRCQVCNRSRNETVLNAHHRTYERLGRERPEDLTVLCAKCHELFSKNHQLAKR